MTALHEAMLEYRTQLEKGVIQQAYRGPMDYMQSQRAHFGARCPDFIVSGGLYFGYMDMTNFACTPHPLAERRLKGSRSPSSSCTKPAGLKPGWRQPTDRCRRSTGK